MSKIEAGRGAGYLYIETLTAMFSGYVFWYFLSKFTTPEVIGTSAAVISLSTIFTTVAGIGVPGGVLRFLGKSFADKKIADVQIYLKSSLVIVAIGVLGSSAFLMISRDWMEDLFKIDYNLLVVAILLIGTTALRTLLRSVVISSLKTKVLVVQSIVSTVAKFAITTALLLVGMGALGVTIGVTAFPILGSVLLALTIMTALKISNGKAEIKFTDSFKNTLTASMASWVPGLIASVGAQLGTIVVLGNQGASQAGFYYIAFSIVTAISTVMSVLSLIAFPILSAMSDGRKRFAWRITKASLIISLPLSHIMIFFSNDIMTFFGPKYVAGSSALEILLLSTVPTAMITGITVLVYAYGNYRQVLAIGLASSIPRTLLYFFLVPIYGGTGAAITYTIGAFAGFLISVAIAKKIKMPILWKELGMMSLIPAAIAYSFSYFHVNYIIAIPISLAISYLIYLKFSILERVDVTDALQILPEKISHPIVFIVNKVGSKLNRNY